MIAQPRICTLAELERDLILKTLETHSRTEAAAALGVSIRTLQLRVRKYRAQGFAIPSQNRRVPRPRPKATAGEVWDIRSNTGCKVSTVYCKPKVKRVVFIFDRICPACLVSFRTTTAIKKYCSAECQRSIQNTGERSSHRLELRGCPKDQDEVAAYLATVPKSRFEVEWVALIAELFAQDQHYRPLIESLLVVKARYAKAGKPA